MTVFFLSNLTSGRDGSFPLVEEQRVMSEALEIAVGAFRTSPAGPEFALFHFALQLVENFLDVSSAFVNDDELIGGKFHLVG